MLKFCPSCGAKILQQSKFCHECGCSFQTALEKEQFIDNREIVEVQCEIEETINQNDFFEQFAEVERQEEVKNEKLLKKAELLFLNYKIDSAEPLLLELSDKGNPYADYMLGLIYENGYGGLEKNVSNAIDIFADLCDFGEVLSCIHFLSFYINNDETRKFIPILNERIMETLDDLKKSDDPLIQYEVANYYNCEHSDQIDHNTAILFYQKAAEQGYWKALTTLGDIFLMGNNCVPNIKKAIQYYEKAGIKGDKVAAYILGNLYYNETIIKKDIQKAKHWYSISANQNDPESLKILANIFLEEKNYFTTIKYYEKEIELNPSSDSGIELAVLYLNLNDKHPDFPKDSNKGIMLLNKALESDNTAASAMYLLGIVYYIGEVIEQDIPKAEKYLKQASESENDEIREAAKDALERIKNNNQKSNSDGCFITTAVCSSMNKTDDCYELMMFRDFRDHWLKKQMNGELLITEYYRIAPQIVRNINKLANAKEIYQFIWGKYLKPCLNSLEHNNKESCKDIYVRMVDDLKNKFL